MKKYLAGPHGFNTMTKKYGLKKEVRVGVDWDSFRPGFCALYPANPGVLCGNRGVVANRLDETLQYIRLATKSLDIDAVEGKLKGVNFKADPSIDEFKFVCVRPGEVEYSIPANNKARFSLGQKDFDAHKKVFKSCLSN